MSNPIVVPQALINNAALRDLVDALASEFCSDAYRRQLVAMSVSDCEYLAYRRHFRWAPDKGRIPHPPTEDRVLRLIKDFGRRYLACALALDESSTEATPATQDSVTTVIRRSVENGHRCAQKLLAGAGQNRGASKILAQHWLSILTADLDADEELKVASVDGNVAFYWGVKAPAQAVGLRIDLLKVDELGDGLSLDLCPSMLTALHWFLEEPEEASGAGGWWTSLDWACDQALVNYERICNESAETSRLKGRYVARWHLDIDLSNCRERSDNPESDPPGFTRGMSGSSHAAAFATCLAVLLARAHLASAATR